MQTKTIVEPDSKYSSLAEDQDVLHWLRNLERGSAVTADASIRRLLKSCELLGLNPRQMIVEAQSDPKQFQDSLEDMVYKLEKEGMAPGYTANLLNSDGGIRSVACWLSYSF